MRAHIGDGPVTTEHPNRVTYPFPTQPPKAYPMTDINSIVNPHLNNNNNNAGSAVGDVTSIMTQVASLSAEKRALEDKLKEHAVIVERFQAQEREEMKKKFDSMIQQWIEENDWTDPELKKSVLDGMQEMVKHNKKDSPIWNMVCCASETHKRNVTKLNQIQTEYNELKGKVEGGSFRSEESRLGGTKRKEAEPSSGGMMMGGGGSVSYSATGGSSGAAGGSASRSMWDDFHSAIETAGVSHFVPDPEVLRGIRSEWVPSMGEGGGIGVGGR